MADAIRGPRSRVLEFSKLEPDIDYNNQGGYPSNSPGQGGNYENNAKDAQPTNGPKPKDISKPFK